MSCARSAKEYIPIPRQTCITQSLLMNWHGNVRNAVNPMTVPMQVHRAETVLNVVRNARVPPMTGTESEGDMANAFEGLLKRYFGK